MASKNCKVARKRQVLWITSKEYVKDGGDEKPSFVNGLNRLDYTSTKLVNRVFSLILSVIGNDYVFGKIWKKESFSCNFKILSTTTVTEPYLLLISFT